MAAEMFNGNTLVLLLVHTYRNYPSLVPIDNVPGAWPADKDVTTQTKIFWSVVNHVCCALDKSGRWGLKRDEAGH